MKKVYIIVGNDGFPRFEDPDATKLYVTKTEEAALDTAKDMAKVSPYTVFGIYKLEASAFWDGQQAIVIHANDTMVKASGSGEED